jgi:hypothetical protein
MDRVDLATTFLMAVGATTYCEVGEGMIRCREAMATIC